MQLCNNTFVFAADREAKPMVHTKLQMWYLCKLCAPTGYVFSFLLQYGTFIHGTFAGSLADL